MDFFAGIDAGSTYVKAVIINKNKDVIENKILPSGVDAGLTAQRLLEELAGKISISVQDIKKIISTGYSRRLIENAHENVTEIRAHAVGSVKTAPDDADIKTIIDIGGQDSKVIVIDETGNTKNFVMNDKCAAGTGRFLESLARVLEMSVAQIGPLSLQATDPCRINSTCAVFAESEIISLLARKKKPVDIIAGIHNSLAQRIGSMARSARMETDILVTGGGGLNPGLVAAFEEELLTDIYVSENPQLNGAIGAALLAADSGAAV
jgi:predicted CoA-substrate-specific enzyme activase